MNEADVRLKVKHIFEKLGCWVITQTDANICPKCHFKIRPKAGRPDLLCLNPSDTGLNAVCEVKVIRSSEESFSFDEISDKQRRWLTAWTDAGGLGYLALGYINPHGKRDYLDGLWIVDWPGWLAIEEIIRPIQKSIPYRAGPGYRKVLQEEMYDCTHLLYSWEVKREEGMWIIRTPHTLERVAGKKEVQECKT